MKAAAAAKEAAKEAKRLAKLAKKEVRAGSPRSVGSRIDSCLV